MSRENSSSTGDPFNPSISLGSFIDENASILSLFVITTPVSAALPRMSGELSQQTKLGITGSLVILTILVSIIVYRLSQQIWYGIRNDDVFRILPYLAFTMGAIAFTSMLVEALSNYPEIILSAVEVIATMAFALYFLLADHDQRPIRSRIRKYDQRTRFGMIVKAAPGIASSVLVLSMFLIVIKTQYIIQVPGTNIHSVSLTIGSMFLGWILLKLTIAVFGVVADSATDLLVSSVSD